MTRTIGPLAVVGLLLVPAGAIALGWPPPPCGVRVYYPPVVYVPVFVHPGAYTPGSPLPPPTVHVSPGTPPAEKPKGNVQLPAENPVRPAEFATPTAAPPDPPTIEALPAPKLAEELPANKLPKQDLPIPAPKAPAPEEGLKLPPLPTVGKSDPAGTPIVLPQLPPPVVPSSSESKYRPATADRPGFAVFPVDGTRPAGANPAWQVGFYNYTDRDLDLRVEGTTVKLPARSYVTAAVPGTFTWRVGTGSDETTTIPAASGGVEVVLK